MNKSTATIYRYVEQAKGQDAGSLLRAVRSDIGRRRHPAATFQIIDDRLAQLRFVPTKRTVDDIVELINGDLRSQDLAEVSRATVYRRIHALKTPKERLQSEGRHEPVRNSYEPRSGHLPDIDYPLSVIEVDHTPCQICFVDSETRQPICDAWLTLVIDCFSRMVLGFYLSFDAPSVLNTGLGLARAVRFLQRAYSR